MIAAGGDLNNLLNVEVITRYPLMADYYYDGTDIVFPNFDDTQTVNAYEKLKNDPDIGLNPNVDFISGTGAYDLITVTPTSATTADVSVDSFTDFGFTTPVMVMGAPAPTYTYSVALNLANGLVIDLCAAATSYNLLAR